MPYPAFYFLSSFKPARSEKADHSSCRSEKCLVATRLSEPHHRSDGCRCRSIIVPIEKVKIIVASGGIPLVKIRRSSQGRTELKVVPYLPSTRSIAISHVWADRQFGSTRNRLPECQVRYLEDLLSNLPTSPDDWGVREWATNWRSLKAREIMPPSSAYEYFWLDSFCVPQAVEDFDLRKKAIESMNLIYAAASHAIVLDRGLQSLDAGRQPAALTHGGRPSYYSPQDENLLDVAAHVYASNWMGRAWTLQEGILSGHIVFPLHGSLVYLKLLWPHNDDGLEGFKEFFVDSTPKTFQRMLRALLPRKQFTSKLNERQRDSSEPFREPIRYQLFEHMKHALHVDDHGEVGSCIVDAWIPLEIVPEKFEGKHSLKLGSRGFNFVTGKDAKPFKFYLLSTAHPVDRFRVHLPEQEDTLSSKYVAEALSNSRIKSSAPPTGLWCMVIDEELHERGARFILDRIEGNSYFLHFDCPLRFTAIDASKGSSDAQLEPIIDRSAVRLHGKFSIERSYVPQDLSISRPQNPQQSSDRLIVIGQVIGHIMTVAERSLIRAIWGDEN
ncbi:MAG: hypothetical protein Q9202_003377 [Teloschistes flavicans]